MSQNRLREFRENAQMTQRAVADQAGLCVRTVRNAEKGRDLRLKTMQSLASVFNKDFVEIFPPKVGYMPLFEEAPQHNLG